MPNYRGVPIQILWGEAFEKTITCATPLDAANAYPLPREGSEWVQASSGVEDAWITGHDEYLRGIVRWIPRADTPMPDGRVVTGWDGANGWRAFLKWARGKNPFRVVRDWPNLLRNPGFEAGGDWWQPISGASFLSDPAIAHSGSGYVEISAPAGIARRMDYMAEARDGARQHWSVRPGDLVTFGAWAQRVSGDGNVRCEIVTLDASKGDASFGTGTNVTVGDWMFSGRASYLIPEGKAFLYLACVIPQGGNTTGTVARFDAVHLKIAPAGDAPLDMYLVDPMTGEPDLERDYTRRLELVMRTVDGSPVEGY